MPVVDVDTIAVEDESQLIDQTLPGCFNSKDSPDLKAVVGYSAPVVDFEIGENFLKGHTVSLNDPVVVGLLVFARLVVILALNMFCESDLGNLK